MDWSEAGEFVANHGLAIFLVVGATIVFVSAMWKPPEWIRYPIVSWINRCGEAMTREAEAQELIAKSTQSISQTAGEIREGLRRQEEILDEIRQQSRQTGQWVETWGEVMRDMVQSVMWKERERD